MINKANRRNYHLLRHDIHTVQGRLGHKGVVTTMIYTHLLSRLSLAIKIG